MLQILKNIPFFASLSDEDLNQIARTVQMNYFPADHIIFEEGQLGDTMYIIKRGKVQVIRDNAILSTLGDHAFFGEMALVSNEPRNATLKTLTDVEVLTLSKEDFNHLLQTNESIATRVSYEVVKRANELY
ncbi:cyclic nucleotide-binding domain-containing protein [Candidatus Peregrinibacteria bacterium]|nr:MAG: cyclic nucleotide-binding domain-containing protein [Candidatus Peregrinibacteria bacterium]